jgi:hypothetical protein
MKKKAKIKDKKHPITIYPTTTEYKLLKSSARANGEKTSRYALKMAIEAVLGWG